MKLEFHREMGAECRVQGAEGIIETWGGIETVFLTKVSSVASKIFVL